MEEAADFRSKSIVVSIVSHGHGQQVQSLLWQLAALRSGVIARVVLTLNIPEQEPDAPGSGWPFVFELVRNASAQGFGRNHNRALKGARERFVCVLNPDVVLLEGVDPFDRLVHAAAEEQVGCAYPRQLDDRGKVQDSERELPTPAALWRRRILGRADRRVDWVNAACLLLPRRVWVALEGFDEGYFMYCEDVDLCLRLRQRGLRLQPAAVSVVHAGQRASRRNFRHLAWHVRSLLRLWRSPAYRAAGQMPPQAPGSQRSA